MSCGKICLKSPITASSANQLNISTPKRQIVSKRLRELALAVDGGCRIQATFRREICIAEHTDTIILNGHLHALQHRHLLLEGRRGLRIMGKDGDRNKGGREVSCEFHATS